MNSREHSFTLQLNGFLFFFLCTPAVMLQLRSVFCLHPRWSYTLHRSTPSHPHTYTHAYCHSNTSTMKDNTKEEKMIDYDHDKRWKKALKIVKTCTEYSRYIFFYGRDNYYFFSFLNLFLVFSLPPPGILKVTLFLRNYFTWLHCYGTNSIRRSTGQSVSPSIVN